MKIGQGYEGHNFNINDKHYDALNIDEQARRKNHDGHEHIYH